MIADPARPRPRPVEALLAAGLLLAAAGLAWRAVHAAEASRLASMGVLLVGAGAGLRSLLWFAGSILGCFAAGGAALAMLLAPAPQDGLATLLETMATLLVAALVAIWVRAGRLAAHADIEELRRSVQDQAVADSLTGVANRRGLELVGQPMIDNARREGQAVYCLLIDVDDMRAVNETTGRRSGDGVLVAVAEAIRNATRSTDVVARWDGDAFVVVGPGTGVSPLEMERRVREHLTAPSLLPRQVAPDAQWQGRVSAGSSTLVPWDEGDLDSLLVRAEQDMALRRALRRRAARSPDPGGVSPPARNNSTLDT